MKNKIVIVSILGISLTSILMLGINKKYRAPKPNTDISNNTSIIDDNKKIYSVVSQENSWAYDVFDTKLISEKADYIAKIKVLDIEDGTYKYSSKNANPTTPIKVETLSILKGDKNTKIDHILKWGGIVTIEEYINNNPIEYIEKIGLNKLSDEEKETKYMKIEESGSYDFQVGKTYVVALRSSDGENFFMPANGYSVFEVNNSSINLLSNNVPQTYKNVLTGNELVLD